LDLGDEEVKVAFQVTSTKSSDKINNTLKKAAGQISKFPTIYVLILQDKQGSYSGLDAHLAKPFAFNADEHILDIGDVLKTVLSLPIDRLQGLFDLVNNEVARVKIELEIPDKNGKYQTNIDSYIEQIPRERFEGIGAYYKHLLDEAKKQNASYDVSEEDVKKDFRKFIKKLKGLPRISRQFFVFMLERGEWQNTNKFINADYLQRVCSFPDMDGELRLLSGSDLCWFQVPDEQGESATWRITTVLKSKSYEFTWEFMDFLDQKKINLEKVVVILDFSDFK
jgi:hypothetical protein